MGKTPKRIKLQPTQGHFVLRRGSLSGRLLNLAGNNRQGPRPNGDRGRIDSLARRSTSEKGLADADDLDKVEAVFLRKSDQRRRFQRIHRWNGTVWTLNPLPSPGGSNQDSPHREVWATSGLHGLEEQIKR